MKHFDDHPVWKWDDATEGHEPVASLDPLPDDAGTLFIRARFVAASGEALRGYLVGLETFHAAGLFVEGEEFVLNFNVPERVAAYTERIRLLLSAPRLRLFPLRYEDDVTFTRSPQLQGVFDLPRNGTTPTSSLPEGRDGAQSLHQGRPTRCAGTTYDG